MLRAYKYRIYPTDEQKALLAKTFGCCRFVYNWALNLKITAYKERKETLCNVYLTNLMKSELKAEHEWLSEVNSQSLQSALRNLDTAYTNFFRNTKAVGFPRFKSRKNKQSFLCPQHCSVDFGKGTISIPKAKDIPAVLHRKFKGTVKTVTVSMTPSGKYFASVLVDTAIRELPASAMQGDTALGIDLGIKSLAVCSDGRRFDNPKNLQRNLDRFAPSSKTCGQCGYVYKGLKLSERSWTCPECGTHHDRDFNAACNIKEFGLKALPTERGKVKPVDCPTVDDRPRVLKSRGRKKQEKRGGIGISEAAKSLV